MHGINGRDGRYGSEVCLHGAYYGDNFGDMLLLGLFCKWIRGSVDGVAVSLPFAQERVRCILGAQYRGFRRLLTANALVYGGGGYFGEQPYNPIRWGYVNLARHAPAATVMRARRKPFAIIGVGVGPITNIWTRKAVLRACAAAEVLAVRDEESYDYLRRIGLRRSDVVITADAALTIGEEHNVAAREIEPSTMGKQSLRIGVHLYTPKAMAGIVEPAVVAIHAFVQDHPETEFVFFDDTSVGLSKEIATLRNQFMQRWPTRIRYQHYKDVWSLVALIRSLDMVVTTKLHVGIVAMALGIPVAAFPYHPKVERLYRQVGASEHCVPLGCESPARFRDALECIYNDGSPTAILVPAVVRRNALLNRTLLERFIRKTSGCQ